MKFYNPFKPHIVQDANGNFWVRILEFLWGWKYSSNYGVFFYGRSFADSYRTKEEAEKVLQLCCEEIKEEKDAEKYIKNMEKVKVIK